VVSLAAAISQSALLEMNLHLSALVNLNFWRGSWGVKKGQHSKHNPVIEILHLNLFN
jgi:hypothetical protein